MRKIAILIMSLAILSLNVDAQYSRSTYGKSQPKSQTTYKSTATKSQTTNKKPAGDNTVYVAVDEMPSYPGGKTEMYKFMKSELKYPQDAMDNGIQGRVIVDFVINRDGTIQDVTVKESVDPSLDAEAVRMVKAMPNWIPAKLDGKTVRGRYTLPVLFKLK